jgi:glycosyltransferase involved in cell wall biosynthesis
MQDNWPLVTVFTLIYNTEPRYIIEAIESIQANNYPNIQHIIIDDCSTDPTPKDIVQKWIAENNYICEFYEHDKNFGICKTCNHVLELAKGKYILACCDDLITPTRIWDDVKKLESLDENYALVFGLSQVIDSESNLKYNVFPTLNELPEDDNYFNLLIYANMIPAPSATIRTECLRKVGGYDEALTFEDYDMWLKLSNHGFQFASYPKINSNYRVHGNSFSTKFSLELDIIKALLKYIDIPKVKQIIRYRILVLGYRDIEVCRASIYQYSLKKKPDILIKLAGSRFPPRLLKKIVSKVVKIKYFGESNHLI